MSWRSGGLSVLLLAVRRLSFASLSCLALACAYAVAACGEIAPPAQDPPPRGEASVLSVPSTSASSSVAASASLASSLPTPSASPPTEPPPPPPRHGVTGSTSGSIACGTSFCKAGVEACTLDRVANAWRCMPAAAELESGGFRCDDSSDCSGGKACCSSFGSASYWTACSKRRGRDSDCRAELCEPGGAACPAGTKCEAGFCEVAQSPTCEANKRCAAGSFCFWSAAPACQTKEQLSKLAEEEVGSNGVLGCTRAADCGVQRCCTGGLGPSRTYCANECDAANNQVICDSAADCAHLKAFYCAGAAGCVVECKRDPSDAALTKSTPPWTKICTRSP